MPLHPQITAAIEGFRRRRRNLLLLRIALTGSSILLSGTLLIAGLDRLFFLPDELRNIVAALLYASLAGGIWLRGGRQLRAPSDPKTLARQMETAAPSPHGQFLAAFELGLAPGGAAGDSAEFRTLLQEQSAAHAAKSDPRILVPIRILRREIAITLGFSIIVGACFLIRGHEFGVLCLRALAPTANLARVSNFQIRILEPAPVEGEFPEGEKLAVQVAITGPATVAPSLETFGGTSTGRTPMRADGRGHFVAGIDLGKSPLQFRIQAGDALTRKFSARPVARPHAVAFQKNYLPPAYSGLSSRNVREEDGHLTALEGTQVELEIQLDQAVRSASINLEREGRSQSLPLVPTKRADVFTCTLPVQGHATYHLELVGAATGFPSRTTPQFEIRAESDLAPKVSLETPVQDFALPLGEKIQIRGHAEDDLGLVSFTQAIRINQGAWTEVPLLSQPGKVCEAQRTWDALVDLPAPGAPVMPTKCARPVAL